jgi:hypothetical protein
MIFSYNPILFNCFIIIFLHSSGISIYFNCIFQYISISFDGISMYFNGVCKCFKVFQCMSMVLL